MSEKKQTNNNRFFRSKSSSDELLKLFLGFGQLIFSTEKSFVFVADLRGWGPNNFSASFAKKWFLALQALPISIANVVFVEPEPFFRLVRSETDFTRFCFV